MKKVTLEWVRKAENEWLVAEREMRRYPPVLEAVCFHAQQCAEKYLKAVLEENGLAAARTHDILQLLDPCASFVPDLSSSKKKHPFYRPVRLKSGIPV